MLIYINDLFTDAPQYHSSTCPCPMQSCPKNVGSGTGPTNKAKGPVSANNTITMAENIPKIPSVTANISCKMENILAPNVVIKPENKDITDKLTNVSKSHDIYSHTNSKLLESPELVPSPSRGSTGLQIPPTVQHEAVQPTENNLNNSSDNVCLSQRKQPRVGKSMERERQQQQHITMIGYQTTLDGLTHLHSDVVALETPQFKQEFAVKKEGEVKVEKVDCDEISAGYCKIKPIENVKLERPEPLPAQEMPTEKETNDVDAVTVNLINESGDECIDYSIKRKHDDDSGNDDVIEVSDNSTAERPSATLKRRKLLAMPLANTPKKSPPNSYKSLIKQTNPSPTYPLSTSKSKLISSSINRAGNKSCIQRRSIFKSKSALKKLRLAVKAKKRANKKKAAEQENDKSSSGNSEESGEALPVLDTTEGVRGEANEKSDYGIEETSTENDNNEEKSMDGSSEYSGKSNIDLTIDRVAKGYFSESDIFSCLSKHRKTKSQKKFAAKLLKAGLIAKKKKLKTGKKAKSVVVTDVPVNEKPTTKKKSKATKEADKHETVGDNDVVTKTIKLKKTKVKESENDLKKTKAKKKLKEVEIVIEKDPLALDDVPSSHSTPKRKPKTPKAVEKKGKKAKVIEVVEKAVEPTTTVDSDEDDKTVETLETRDEETSTTVLSSDPTINTNKSILDETDVANNNNECFEDNNRHKLQQESLTLYKTPGYGWTTFGKGIGKRGKKAKFGNRKKHKFTLLNDIVIPKSTSIPRWSNGWVWEGEPYQALVFLNVRLSSFSLRNFYL